MEKPDFKYGDLINKEKAELERIKLSMEIGHLQNSSKEKWDLRKFNQETIRLVIMVILTAGISFLSSFYFHKENLKLKRISDFDNLKFRYLE